MGHPAVEASARRQSAFTHRDKHHATLQRASAPIGVTVYGQVCPEVACVVVERSPWRRRSYWIAQRGRRRAR
jgi:hypothetical protein